MELGLFILFSFALIFAIGAYVYVRYTDKRGKQSSHSK